MTKDDGFGPNLDALWSWYDRDLCSWRMSQDSLPLTEDTPSETSSVTWPSSGTMRNGRCYPQAMWEPPISVKGYGSSHTALASGHNVPTPTASDSARMPNSGRNSTGPTFHEVAEQGIPMWPTPDVRGFTNTGSMEMLKGMANSREEWAQMAYRAGVSKKEKIWPTPTQDSIHERSRPYAQGGTPLTLAVKQWPTPTASDAPHPNMVVKKGRRITKHGKEHSIGLEDSVKMWPTPDASQRGSRAPDLIQLGGRSVKRRGSGQVRGIDLETAVGSGQLNPTWVAWLMGFPTGWLS
jgi:hypothetical protein